MVQNLENMGFTVVPFGQGFKDMSQPSFLNVNYNVQASPARNGVIINYYWTRCTKWRFC